MKYVGLDYDLQLLEKILAQLDITLSSLRDAIRGIDDRTLTDIYNIASGIKAKTDKLSFDVNSYLYVNVRSTVNPPNLDVALSTRASESTVSGIKTKTDKLTFDDSNRLMINLAYDSIGLARESTVNAIKSQTDKLSFDDSNRLIVNAQVVANPSNLDVKLSTRASESTLSGFSAKFPSAVSLGDSLGNPSTTIVGSALLGWTGSVWRRVIVDTSGRLRSVVESLPSLPSGSNIIGGVFAEYNYGISINQQVDTTEVTGSTVDVRRRSRRVVYIKNTQDVTVYVTIEASYNGSDWYVVRSDIEVPANDYRIGVINEAHGYIRAKARASSSPSGGSVLVAIASIT